MKLRVFRFIMVLILSIFLMAGFAWADDDDDDDDDSGSAVFSGINLKGPKECLEACGSRPSTPDYQANYEYQMCIAECQPLIEQLISGLYSLNEDLLGYADELDSLARKYSKFSEGFQELSDSIKGPGSTKPVDVFAMSVDVNDLKESVAVQATQMVNLEQSVQENRDVLDVMSLVQEVLRQSYLENSAALDDYSKRLSEFKAAQDEIRGYIQQLRNEAANLKGEIDKLPVLPLNQFCPANQVLVGIDVNGNIVCK